MEINSFRVDIYNEYNAASCIFFNNSAALHNRSTVLKGEFANCTMSEQVSWQESKTSNIYNALLRNVNNLSLNNSHSSTGTSILIFNEFLLQLYECACYPQSQMMTEQITMNLIFLILQFTVNSLFYTSTYFHDSTVLYQFAGI